MSKITLVLYGALLITTLHGFPLEESQKPKESPQEHLQVKTNNPQDHKSESSSLTSQKTRKTRDVDSTSSTSVTKAGETESAKDESKSPAVQTSHSGDSNIQKVNSEAQDQGSKDAVNKDSNEYANKDTSSTQQSTDYENQKNSKVNSDEDNLSHPVLLVAEYESTDLLSDPSTSTAKPSDSQNRKIRNVNEIHPNSPAVLASDLNNPSKEAENSIQQSKLSTKSDSNPQNRKIRALDHEEDPRVIAASPINESSTLKQSELTVDGLKSDSDKQGNVTEKKH